MAFAAIKEFALELVYHHSFLAGIQIVTIDDSLLSHLHFLSERTRKLLVEIRLRLAQLKKDRAVVSTHISPPSTFVEYAVRGNAPVFTDTPGGMPPFSTRRHAQRRKPNDRE